MRILENINFDALVDLMLAAECTYSDALVDLMLPAELEFLLFKCLQHSIIFCLKHTHSDKHANNSSCYTHACTCLFFLFGKWFPVLLTAFLKFHLIQFQIKPELMHKCHWVRLLGRFALENALLEKLRLVLLTTKLSVDIDRKS